ncbi:transposase [Fluviicola chungangensis]|uniref:Transposase IS200-like domain-containing protein n=1 Tax=Fluviicola chungangensis TaxID=2597671 RepID=A0A556MGL3_9FLAO|nr:transposase [Fluviicola chungangensis]TSJ39074.1 hypothetical protein FO442_18040 [Fluviicola chungangensis]
MSNHPIHRRKSQRLNGYDYAKEGLYFITIKTENNRPLFGEIINGIMKLDESGLVAQNCWLDIPKHFPHAALHEFVIMPDHVHGIIEIVYNPNYVGAKNFSPLHNDQPNFKSPSKTIGSIIRGFKTGVTKWMRNHTTVHDVWQRNYHDHIIRNTESYERICQYIRDNPKKWHP